MSDSIPPGENNEEKKQVSDAVPDTEKEIERDPVFYYSREHRLSHASPIVQSMNGKAYAKQGLTKRMFGSKSNLVLFATILIICASFALTGRYMKKQGNITLGENSLALTMIQDQDTAILGIVKKVPKSGEFYTGTVELIVSQTQSKEESEHGAPEFFNHHIRFNPVETETITIPLPFEGNDFIVILKTANEQKSIRLKIKDTKKK